jgi:hypothetical protein
MMVSEGDHAGSRGITRDHALLTAEDRAGFLAD